MDVTLIRNILIQHNGLLNTNDVYTFYYDESNNIRKLYLKDSRLNVEKENNFVLAGIVHRGLSSDADFSVLLKKLNLQKNVTEVKLKHIAKGGFLDLLKSEKLCFIFEWLKENEFYLHYFNLNIVYWSVIDIVDSIISELDNRFFTINHMPIKSDFYEIANKNSDVFLKRLGDFNYPDVPAGEVENFCKWIIEFVKENKGCLPEFRAKVLEDLVNASLDVDEMPFISGSHGLELISGFMVFYLRNLYLFKNSQHIFDEEKSIQDDVESFPLTDDGKPVHNHRFVKSHDSVAIQVSDVIAGFFGKYFTYLKDVTDQELASDMADLTSQQKKTLAALRELIDVSDDVSEGFFNVVNSENEREKNNWFLHGVDKSH